VDIWRRQNASCGIVLRFSSYSKFIPKTKFKLRNFSEIQKSIRKRSKVSTEVSKQDSKAQRLFQSIWHSTWRSKMFTLSLEILFHPRSDLSTMRLKEHDKKKHESFFTAKVNCLALRKFFKRVVHPECC
jgi:hypothetical protein